ncbi:MAG: glycosyl hydrolase family 8 [Cytophagaceae bacterium]|jgi:endo-1,4-beta-D-glucanase Y|nr:glycosyl hydrolase family 8 [Cytophagaceae bacterium]
MKLFPKLLGVCLSFTLLGQINTPSGATMPFGANPSYGNGILPTNLPTGGTYGKSQDAADAYIEWKNFYVDQSCNGGTQARVKFDDVSKTVSEGIAYGMLLSVYAADKPLFDKLWAYYKANSNGNGIMNWKINGCSGVNGPNGATDAELDAAMALIIAESQWPNLNSPYDYGTEANTLISKIKQFEMESGSYQAINGDGWGFGNSCRNPSYQSPAYYTAFANHVSSDATFWNNAVSGAYTLITANAHGTTGLVSDWSDNNGNKNQCNGGYDGYGFDACRNPWRMATDVIWWNRAQGATQCNKYASYINSQGAGNVRGPRNLDGSGGGNHNATFVSTYAMALVGAASTHQSLLNSMYTETKNVKDALQNNYPSGYFGNTLRCLALFVMSGNFWKPGSQATQEIDIQASSASIPNGGTFDFQNVQNSSNKSVTFTIENKGSLALSLTGSPIVNVTSGATNFSVTTQPSTTTISGGNSTTFVVRFTPGSNGVKNGAISISNNDANENPYIINLTGTGTATATSPEIAVSYNAANVTTGGTVNLGALTQNAIAYYTFTITNSGDAPLNISNAAITGTGYSIDALPPASIAIGGSGTFRIKLNPTSTGTKTGSISFNTDDPDENPFTISLTANATSCATSITNTSVIQDYEANNNVALAYTPVGAINQAFVNPNKNTRNPSHIVAQYVRSTTNDYDGIAYTSCGTNFTLTTAKPIISILVYSPQIGVEIVCSPKKTGALPINADYSSDKKLYTTKANQWERLYFDLSNVVVNTSQFVRLDFMIDPLRQKLGASAADRTFLLDDIRFDANPCLTDLPASEVFNDFEDHKNISLVYGPASPSAYTEVFNNPSVGGMNTSALVAKFDRGATGAYAVAHYSACGGSLNLSGKTVISMLVYSSAVGADITMALKNASSVDVLASTRKTTVANQWQRLYFDFSGIAGNTSVAFLDIFPDPTIAKGAATYYFDDIRYDVNPCFTGIATTGVMMDYDNNRYLIQSNSNAAFNDIIVNPSATGINTSATVARLVRPATGPYNLIRYASCGTNFDLSPGKTVYALDVYSPVANTRVTMMLKKANQTTTLVADSALVTAANTWQTITFDFSAAVSDNSGAFLDIYLDPNIANGAQTYYIDNLRFAPPAPEINVKVGSATILTDGSYNMGSVQAGSSSSPVIFTIQNNGTSDLNLTSNPKISISGANSAEFTIDEALTISPIGAVSTTTFYVTFSPVSAGSKTALITINNNDANESQYKITLNGTATALPAPDINAKVGTVTYLTGSTYDFGTITEATTSQVQFTLENLGNAPLTITNATVNSTEYQVQLLTPNPDAAILVTFSPTSTGTKNAILTITSNDPDENPYVINLAGIASVNNSLLETLETSVQIAPNPVQDVLNVTASSALPGETSLRLYNYQGQLVFQGTLASSSSVTIPMTQLTSGIYSLELANGKTMLVKKIMKP